MHTFQGVLFPVDWILQVSDNPEYGCLSTVLFIRVKYRPVYLGKFITKAASKHPSQKQLQCRSPEHPQYAGSIVLILVWPTSWTPAVGGLFVCVCACVRV